MAKSCASQWSRHPSIPEPIWEHLCALIDASNGKQVCERMTATGKCKVSHTLMSLVLHGKRGMSAPFRAALLTAYPMPEEAKKPEVQTVEYYGRGLQNPESIWLNEVTAEVTDRVHEAKVARAKRTEMDRLGMCLEYRALSDCLLSSSSLDVSELLIPEPVEGQSVEMLTAIRRVRDIIAESTDRQSRMDPKQSSDLYRRHSTSREAWRSKVERLIKSDDPEQLAKCQTWVANRDALCSVMRDDTMNRANVIAALGDNPFERDLRKALEGIRSITFPCVEFQDDIIGFFETVLGEEPWTVSGDEDDQRSFLVAVQKNKRTVCTSGRGAGKTRGVAGICLWRYCSWEDGRVVITNFTGNQLKAQDWAEIHRLLAQSGICLTCRKAGVTQRPCPHSQIIDFAKASEDPNEGIWSADRERFIIGVTGRAVMSLGGWHGIHLMIICDEFSGVTNEMMNAWRGNIAGDGNKFLGAGNPLDGPGNPMYEYVNTEVTRKLFGIKVIVLSAETAAKTGLPYLPSMSECEIAAYEDESLERKSPIFMINWLGQYPTRDELAVYRAGDIIRAQKWEHYEATPALGPLVIAIDPSGESGLNDDACIGVLRGLKLLEKRVERGLSFDGYLTIVEGFIEKYRNSVNEVAIVGVDADGVGQKVIIRLDNYLHTKRLEEHDKVRFEIVPVYFGQIAPSSLKYDLVADEAHAHLSNWLSKGGTFEADAKLADEMKHTRWTPVRRKRGEIWYDNLLSSTRKFGDRSYHQLLHRSPDRLDMLRVYAYVSFMRELAPFVEERSQQEDADAASSAATQPTASTWLQNVATYRQQQMQRIAKGRR